MMLFTEETHLKFTVGWCYPGCEDIYTILGLKSEDQIIYSVYLDSVPIIFLFFEHLQNL